jgi:hypothetical protein
MTRFSYVDKGAWAEAKWAELNAEDRLGISNPKPVQRCRFLRYERNREMIEAVGRLADHEDRMDLRHYNWLESYLCILAPINSTQAAAFEMLKVSGLLCSKYGTALKEGQKYITLAATADIPKKKARKRTPTSAVTDGERVAHETPAEVGGSPLRAERLGAAATAEEEGQPATEGSPASGRQRKGLGGR